jgi:5'-3' exonuclease
LRDYEPETRAAVQRGLAGAPKQVTKTIVVHLIDGTYELFRHFYGQRRFNKGKDRPFGAVVGVLQTVLEFVERGEKYIGVATDHVIESFRNRLWAGCKTGEGVEPALLSQFEPLEDALSAMGITVWPMTELEADDALASAAHLASADDAVAKVCIWTPDRTSRNAWRATASCKSTAEPRPSGMQPQCARSSASNRS